MTKDIAILCPSHPNRDNWRARFQREERRASIAFFQPTDQGLSTLWSKRHHTFFCQRVQGGADGPAVRLPAMYPFGEFTASGGLMAYSANRTEMYRRSETFVDKILKGAKPADLPVEQPTTFELVINHKAAKALGLPLPQSLLLRADRLIE